MCYNNCSAMTSLFVACVVLLLSCQIPTCSSLKVEVDAKAVVDQLTKLATFTDDPNPAVTRILFTPNDLKAREYVKSLMKDAGLTIREDAVGNIYGRLQGSDTEAGTVLSGSHCDAIPLAGMYDGTLGVIGAIQAAAALKRAGFKPKRTIEVMMFTSEEPTRFGLSCIGSRAMSGALSLEALDALKDENGTNFKDAASQAGYVSDSHEEYLKATLVKPGEIDYFVELHIEQGPLLEEEGLDIGAVTAIAAPAALEVFFKGGGGHAGALLMPFRNDAGLAAAELALEVEKFALETKAIDTVATTGIFEVKPNAVNSVPREARLGIDVRDIDGPRRDKIVTSILESAERIAAARKVEWSYEVLNKDPPATCSQEIVDAIEEAAQAFKLSHRRMVSRAYHDSLFMARIAPTAMIFVPCYKGYSHRPDEFASEEAIRNGVQVLAYTLAKLAGSESHDSTEL